jgi:hypothetical protein
MIRVDMNRVLCVFTRVVLSAALVLPSWGQEPIRGPMLGWVWDGHQESIRPILGIVGSSVLGKPLALDFPVKFAAIAGRQEFALALGGEGREAFFIDLRGVDPQVRKLEAPAGARRILLSPRATAAVLVLEEPYRLAVIGGLDKQPALLRELDLSVEGAPAALAVSDDGSLVVATYPESNAVRVLDASGNRWKAPKEGKVSHAAFLENSRDLLLAADDGVYRIRDLADNATVQQVSTIATSGAVAAIDGQNMLLINGENQSVVELNLESGVSRSVQCPCDPKHLVRMSRGALFRLNEYNRSALWLVEINEGGLRTLFVPPDPSDPVEE